MRPLELTIQGFKSYRQRCSFNFEGRGLFGIVGPTGAGKSSILDALIYCLYGKTPRLERETKKLINSEEDEAKLQLSFEMDGIVWEVTRVVRRKGQSQVLLRRLDDGAEPVTGDRNVNEKLPQILGLDFGAFCASVCLSQGEFDRFLRATPSERVQILKGVFALDKVDALREAAKGRSRLINDQMRILQGTLDALPSEIEEKLKLVEAELTSAKELVGRIREALPAVVAAEDELKRSVREEQLLFEQRRAAQRALESIPDDRLIDELVDREERAEAVEAAAEKTLAAADEAAARAEQELSFLETEGKGPEWCSNLDALIRTRTALFSDRDAHSAAIDVAQAALRAAQAALDEAGRIHSDAELSLERVKDELSEIEHTHAAHLLRSELKHGEPCPVCTQTVIEIPPAPGVPALDIARAALERAEHSLTQARNNLELRGRDLALAAERRRSVEESARGVAAKLAENAAALRDLIGDEQDPRAALQHAKQALDTCKNTLQKATWERQTAFSALKQASAARGQAAAEILKLVTAVSGVCGSLGLDPNLIAEEGLAQTVKRLQEQGGLKLNDIDQQSAALSASLADARSTMTEFRSRFNAKEGESPAEVLARAISEVQACQNRKQDLEAAQKRRAETESQSRELAARKSLLDRLSGDLTDAKFTAYLLSEQTRLLCELASQKFHDLSGYYTFDFDAQGNITVVDERTGAVRSPQDTLSGGESFLASLSLALALAETVASRGGRLECFFLDEGFGSLDAEALDRALEGIQTLAEPGRMIGLISHVGGIQSQLEDLLVLERNSDGSTSVVQESGPIAYLPAAI